MSNYKQSSVEWLYQEFERIDKEFHVGTYEYNDAKNLALKISKAMHRVEVVNAVDGFPIHARHMDGEEYYNETFGGNNEQ